MGKTQERDPVVGQMIVGLRSMTRDEAEAEGWELDRIDGPPTVIVLSSGALLYPSRDVEGNGPGALFGLVNGRPCSFAAA